MKTSILLVLALAVAAYGRPEPPVNNYLPPSYSTTQQDSFAPPVSGPSSTYGAPSAPSSTYGAPSAPSSTYGAPSSTYGAPSAPSSTYGAPSAPSSTYGAPSSTYGAPSRGSASRSSFGPRRSGSRSRLAPSQTYGAPAQTTAIFAPSATYGAPSSVYGAPAFGGYPASKYSGAQDDLSEPAMYEFSYEVKDPPSGNDFGHREAREGDVAWGSYQVVLPDGRKQIVDYQADQSGYNPKIRYEETGYPAARGAGGPY